MIGLRADMDAAAAGRTERVSLPLAPSTERCTPAVATGIPQSFSARRASRRNPDFDSGVAVHLPAGRGIGRRRRRDDRDGLFELVPGRGRCSACTTGRAFRGRDGGDAGPVMAGTCAFGSACGPRLPCGDAAPGCGLDRRRRQLVQALQTVVSHLHPLRFGGGQRHQFHGGAAWNVIPEVVLRTIRSFKPEVQGRRGAPSSAWRSGASQRRSASFRPPLPAQWSTAWRAEICRSVAAEVLGVGSAH